MKTLLSRSHSILGRAALATVRAFTPTNTGEAALYNNSSGPHVIAVWDVVQDYGNNGMLGYLLKQGTLGTLVGPGQSVTTGEASPVGVAYKDDLASPDTIQAIYPAAQYSANCTLPFPLAVLLPGWSMVMVSAFSNKSFGVSFYYQWLYADEYGYNARTAEYVTE